MHNNKYFDDSKEYVFGNIDNWVKEIARVLKEHCHCFLYVPSLEIDKWIYSVKKYLTFNNLLAVSNYTTHSFISNNFDFSLQPVLYCSKGIAKDFNYIKWIKTSNSWYKDKRNKNPKEYTRQYPSYIPKEFRANVKPNEQIKLIHPCQKNEGLIEKFILLSSKIGDIVLDPFAGSGSTLTAAKKLRRNYIGYEISPDYHQKAMDNLTRTPILEKKRIIQLLFNENRINLMNWVEGEIL